MKKKVVAANCKIVKLPEGCTAKLDNKGAGIIKLPQAIVSVLETYDSKIETEVIAIDDFEVVSLDKTKNITLIGMPNSFDETAFH